jgi:SnoaL-like domain
MNPISVLADSSVESRQGARWRSGGAFLDALARRDFVALESCLHPNVRFRALVPPGTFEATGPTDVVSNFRRWFGGDDDFEVVDASIGQVRPRLYLRWRVRMTSPADPASSRLAEQHAFATAGELIDSLDLLCSGFQAESGGRPIDPAVS